MTAACLLLAACGSSKPSERQARDVFNNSFQELGQLGVKVLEFRKVNAEVQEVVGQKIYTYHFIAIEELPAGLAWESSGLLSRGGIVKDPGKEQPVRFGGGKTKGIPKGTIALRREKITFRMTENGWVSKDLPDTADDAYCPNMKTEDCIKSLGWNKLQ